MTASKRKRTNVLDTLSDLERRLPTIRGDTVASAALAEDVRRRCIRNWADDGICDGDDGDDGDDSRALVHKAAVQLWNLVLQLDRESEKAKATAAPASAEFKCLLLHSRVFAFATIHRSVCPDLSSVPSTAAVHEGDPTRSQAVYLLDIAVRAAQSCIDARDIELGRLVLERAHSYREYLGKAVSNLGSDTAAHPSNRLKQLEDHCTVLQLTQLWRENKLHDADELYRKGQEGNRIANFDAATSADLTVALLEIGKALLSKKDFSAAITWLDRASGCLPKEGQTATSTLGSAELCIATTHSLAIACLGMHTLEGHTRAQELVTELKSSVGPDDRRVQLLQLELFASPLSEIFDGAGYADVLLQVIKTFSASTAEFQLLHHHIQKLHNKSPGLGCKVLDEFMLALRNKDSATEWAEKLIITRVWLLAHQRETEEELDAAQSVLSKLRMPIGADTAAAAQTLMWKRIEQGYQERHYTTAMRWCRLALCHVFEASGRANRPLIERKLLLCSIESGDLEAAKSIYIGMPEPTRDEPMTKYLLYKLSIQTEDLAMATECLRGIAMSSQKSELLHACVLHAKHAKAPRFLVQALKKLADATCYNEPDQIHAPAIFRCTILMLRDMIDDDSEASNTAVDETLASKEQAIRDLSELFGGVVDAIEADRNCHTATESQQFTIDELEWFCRAAYNLGLKYSGKWDLRYTVRILDACVRITNLFPVGQETHIATDVRSKRLACRFLIASALAALVRRPSSSGPGAEEQALKDCHAMREHIRAFQVELRQLGKTGTTSPPADLFSKLSVLAVFDFEGAVRLGDWDELESICEMAAGCQNTDTLRVLGDSLLRSQAHVPTQKFLSTMRLIVSKLREADHFSSEKLIKYYRCLFQAALYRDNDSAFQVLEEVGRLMQTGMADKSTMDWPENELEFLATVAFNEGMDWFAGGREDHARQWVLLAANVAGQCHDGGKLKELICARFGLLQVGGLEIKQSVESDAPGASAVGTLSAVETVGE